MNEYEMKLVEKLIETEKRMTLLQAKVDILMAKVVKEEIEDAQYRARSDGAILMYGGTIRCEEINAIFGWARSEEAVKLIEEARNAG